MKKHMNRLAMAGTAIVLSQAFTLAHGSWSNWVFLPQIDGTPGDDVIDENYTTPTTDNAEEIWGRSGNDIIRAQGGDDVIVAGEGDDEVHGQHGDDSIEGGGGADSLQGNEGEDTIHGGQGNDHIYGGPDGDSIFGDAHNDYLDGQEGVDTIDGGTNSDLVIGRDGNDTLIGGPGDDFIVIIGNSIENHTIHGDSSDPGANNVGDDLLFFARDVNPDNFMHKTLIKPNGDEWHYTELEFGLHTNQPVHLDVNAASNLRHVQAFATGSADDHIIGTDNPSTSTYDARFLYAGNPMWVGELFFTHDGNDIIDTGGGHDFVDAGAGNDTILCPGAGEFHLITGPGDDTVRFIAADLDGYGQAGRTTIIYDLKPGDRLEIKGSLAPSAVTAVDASEGNQSNTMIQVNGDNEFKLLGVSHGVIEITSSKGGVLVTNGPPKHDPDREPRDRDRGRGR